MGDNQYLLNKNDIKHLEDKVDNLDERVDELNKNTPSSDDFKQLELTIRKVLLEGNGNKPLTTRVAKNQSKIEQNRSSVRRIYSVIASIPFVGSAIVGIMKAVGWL